MTRVIGFDCETYPMGTLPKNSKKTKVSVNSVPRMVCMTSHDGRKTRLLRGAKAVDQFIYWLEHENTVLVAHNAKYDVLVMVRAAWEQAQSRDILDLVFAAYEQGRIRDTGIRERLLDIAKTGYKKSKPYYLHVLTKQYLGIDISATKGEDSWRLRYNQLDSIPTRDWPEEAVTYAEKDAVYAYKIYLEQMHDQYAADGTPMVEQTMVRNEHLQTMADVGFGLMSAWGMTVDIEYAQQTEDKYRQIQEDLEDQLMSVGLMSENRKKILPEVQRVFAAAWAAAGIAPSVENKGLTKPTKTFPDGQISTGKEARIALEDFDVGDPKFRLLSLHTKTKTFRSMYLAPMLMAWPHRVCSSFGLVESGRSSSKGPNLQNLPKRDYDADPFKASDVRRCFVPSAGNVFVDADYSTLELRTLAQLCLNLGFHSEMAVALQQGRDLHTDLACQLLHGLDYHEAIAILDDDTHPRYKDVKKARNLAKVANFGYPGGLGARRFISFARGYGIIISYQEALDLRQAWLTRWPEMNDYFNYVTQMDNGDKFVFHQHGPQRDTYPWRVRACATYPSACNSGFQGMAADGCKFALWMILRACYIEKDSPLYGFRVVMFVHDQFLLEGPEARASDAAKELVRLMAKGMAIMVPDLPAPSVPAIGRRWDVDMKSDIDDNGDYTVYEAAA